MQTSCRKINIRGTRSIIASVLFPVVLKTSLSLVFMFFAVGAFLCALGFLSAIIVGLLDKYGVKQLGQDVSLQQDSKKLVNFIYYLIVHKGQTVCIYKSAGHVA